MMLSRLRRFAPSFALAAAFFFAVAQHAALLHDLGHAAGVVHGQEKPGTPPAQKCDTHYACAQLAGAAPASPPAIPRVERSAPPQFFHLASEALQSPRLAFLSRAPPA